MAASRQLFGRAEPDAGLGALLQSQSGVAGPPKTSFGQVNGTGTGPTPIVNGSAPFTWLPHLDRQLVSPMELLQVSAFKPHELTQQFINPTPTAQRAPWFDEDPTLPAGNSHLL